MVSATHEVMHRLIRDHPDTVGEMFRSLGFDFPENAEITSVSEDVTDISPAVRHVDSVLRVGGRNDPAAFILAIEAQSKPDPDKLYSWPQYAGALRGRHRLEVALVVICRDRKTAEWARAPIESRTPLGLTSVTYPLALGPDNVPVPTGPITESGLLAASLAVVVHGKDPGIDAIMEALAQALDKAGPKKKAEFAGYVELGLKGLAAEKKWRDLVALNAEMLRSSSVFAEILDDERVGGRAEGEAETILTILAYRDVPVTGEEQQRIRACTDKAQLDRWVKRAITATSSAELFD